MWPLLQGLGYGDLHRIASGAASHAPPYLREDAYQEAWVRFIRYPPPCKLYAWRAANSARNQLLGKEARHQRIKLLDPILLDTSPGVLVPRPRRRMILRAADPNGTT